MTTLNSYASLADYKAWIAVRGLSGSVGTDVSDDAAIEQLLRGVSRYMDSRAGRYFHPYVEIRYFDVPFSKELRVDADLLEVITLTNGDGAVIPSTEYNLVPKNRSPHYAIRLKDTSTYVWGSDDAETQDVIAVTGIWGYHDRYGLAWLLGSTLAEALDVSETNFDVTSGSLFAIGQVVRFDNELSYLSGVSSNTLTGTRGENGSTAATHDSGENTYIWQTMDDIKTICLEIAQNVYGLRSGQSSAGKVTVTAAGVVIRPEEVPPMASQLLNSLRDIT